MSTVCLRTNLSKLIQTVGHSSIFECGEKYEVRPYWYEAGYEDIRISDLDGNQVEGEEFEIVLEAFRGDDE